MILTADHGEEFGEHGGLGHTRTLYDELVHVPLVMRFRGKSPEESASPAGLRRGHLSYGAWVCRWTGCAGSKLTDSRLAELLATGANSRRTVFSEVDFKSGDKAYRLAAAVRGSQKLIWDLRAKQLDL